MMDDQYVFLEKDQHSTKEEMETSYNEPIEVKEVNLAKLGEEPKPMFIEKYVTQEEEKSTRITENSSRTALHGSTLI